MWVESTFKVYWVKWDCHPYQVQDYHKGYMGKEKLLALEFYSFCKHDGRKKITPPCSMLLKANFIGLTFFNLLKKFCFILPIMGQICWTRSCQVWHMMAQTKWFRLSQCVLPTPKMKAHKWIWWEHERLVIILSSQKLSTQTFVG